MSILVSGSSLAETLKPWQRAGLTILACAGTTLLATPLLDHMDLANIVMLFLLTVLLLAVSLGRGAAVLAAVLNVLLFDIFFVPPRFSLAVHDAQYLVTFAVMLATGLIAGQLAAGLKQKAREAQLKEERTQALYEVALQLAGALNLEHAEEIVCSFIRQQFSSEAVVLPGEKLGPPAANSPLSFDIRLARMAWENGHLIWGDNLSETGCIALYIPLKAATRTLGVLKVLEAPPEVADEYLHMLEALASLLAITMERLHYVEVAQSTQINMAAERLRSSILSALSHDLRTPLTALVGLADSLSLIKPPLPAQALDTAQAIHEQATRLAGLVGNLLDMARLNAGDIRLKREWQPLEEVIGASIKLLGNGLESHPVRVNLPPDLPLLEFDAVLMERVFCNLLENAAKYSPPGGAIDLEFGETKEWVSISVCDRGKGLPSEDKVELFNMFVRGETESGPPGTGLGLAISRAIIEAHGGSIEAENRDGGGACIRFTLPKGNPPTVEEEQP